MSTRPAIVDHELNVREHLQQRASRRKATGNGAPKPSGEWINLPGGEKFYVQSYDGDAYAVSGYQPASEAAAEPAGPKLFRCRPMAEDMQNAQQRPLPKPLFGSTWSEGETVIVFGETGAAKTVAGIQLANDIASGVSTTGLELQGDARKVLYFDFELSDMQHLRRYSEQTPDGRFTNAFKFHPNFLRVEMNPSTRVFDRIVDYEQFMIREIEREIIDSGADVIFIDNLTYLARETDKSRQALPLMQRLVELKKDHNLSMAVMAHTPKRDESRPMSLNDLAGSRILANFTDAIFSIGKSALDSHLRILKQHKARSSEMVYTSEHVGVFSFEKTSNFLGLELLGHSHEKKHLQAQTDEAREKLIAEVRAMKDAGRSHRDVARVLQIAPSTVSKYLNHVKRNEAGEIEFLDPERQKLWIAWEQK